MSNRKYHNESLQDLITEMLRKSGLERKFNELEVIECYKNVVGDLIARKTREIYLKERTLVVKMDSGVLKQELHFEKKKIISSINNQLESPFLEEMEVW